MPETSLLSARTRLFYRQHGVTAFGQFPGMHLASNEHARYCDEELNYLITRASTQGAMIHSSRVFEAAFTGGATEWTADDDLSGTGRPDSLAMVASPLFSLLDRTHGVIGVIVFEVLAPSTSDHRRMVEAIKPLVPEFSKFVASACVEMQPFFLRYWP
jgi:hypothetical protein